MSYYNNDDLANNLDDLSKETEKSFQSLMDKFDEIDNSMSKTLNAMYFLYGGIVALMILALAEAFLS